MPSSNKPARVPRTRKSAPRSCAAAASGSCTGAFAPPGYYTALIRQENWPPNFEPQPTDARGMAARAMSTVLSAARERDRAAGLAWAAGTVSGPRAGGKR